MRSIISLLLEDFGIPYESVVTYDANGNTSNGFCIPNYANAVLHIIDSEIVNECNLIYPNGDMLTGLSDRETLEHIILYLCQNHTNLKEKVPYTSLNWNDPEVLITELIEKGSEYDETPDMIANKILEYCLLHDVRELVARAVEEL